MLPIKTKTIRPLEPQWLTTHIKIQIRKRKRLYKKAKLNNMETMLEQI